VTIHDDKKCPNCNSINEPGADQCSQCGASMTGVTTLAVVEEAVIDVLQPLVQPPSLNVNEVMFLVAGHKDPIKVKIPPDQTEIVLGRRGKDEKLPHFDLTYYGTAGETISRRHAALRFLGNVVTIEDLGSTNGTWLNESQLTAGEPHAIKTGDLVRLGQQFVFVYFSAAVTTVDTIVLTECRMSILSNRQMTPEWFTHYLGSYLLALEGVQKSICDILRQPAPEVVVRDMDLREAPTSIQLRIAGASGAIRLIWVNVSPWRKQHLQQLNQLWQATPDKEDQVGAVRTTLFEELGLLGSKILEQLAPDLSELDRVGYMHDLMPNLSMLALHSLEISAYRDQ
jgi:pSer/pThr/pTyr-binding forkhead associated (FHA) protein